MYIIACRAHFCHLLGLGQVGHSPRETSGSAWTLDWGPMWLGSQSTCHSQYIPTHPNSPQNPRRPQCPLMLPIPLLALEYLHSLPACNTPPISPDTPQCTPTPPTPLKSPYIPLCHLYPSSLSVPTLTASPPIHPWHLHPWFPQQPLNTPYTP